MIKQHRWGLAAFFPERPVGALPHGAIRYYVDTTCAVSGSVRSRACIALADGQRYFEVPCVVRDGVMWRPTIHTTQYICKASYLSANWLFRGRGARGTVLWDLFHRDSCDLQEAYTCAGLNVVKLECIQVLKLRKTDEELCQRLAVDPFYVSR